MIEAILHARAWKAYLADEPILSEPKPIEPIQRVVVDTTSPEREKYLITGQRHTTVVEAVNGDRTVFQFVVFDARIDIAVKQSTLDSPLIPEEVKQSKEEPLEIAILMGGSSDANSSVRTIVPLLRELYQASDSLGPLKKPVRITLLSHPHGSPHEGDIIFQLQSAALLKRAYEQVAQQANIGPPQYLIGHSAGSLIAHLATPDSILILNDPTGLEANSELWWKFLAIPWRELIHGVFKDKNLFIAGKNAGKLSKEALSSPQGGIGNFNPLREYSIGWFIPPSFFHDLGERWGLRRVRGINPSIKQLSRRDQIFDDLKAKMYLFQQRGSEVVSLLARDPNGKRRSPRNLLLADREELERELADRVNQVMPGAQAKLLEGHHNEILTGDGPMREIAAIIRGVS